MIAASAPLFGNYDRAIALAALGIPFIALTSVYLGATRGLTQMRQTLYVFWIGQPVVWIAIAGAAIAAGGESDAVVLAYGASWLGRRGRVGALAPGGTRLLRSAGYEEEVGQLFATACRARPPCSPRRSSGRTSGCSPPSRRNRA